MTVRTRLFLMLLGIVGLGFYLLVDWIVDDLQPRYLETMEESMVDTASLLAAVVSSEVEREAPAGGSLRQAFAAAVARPLTARIYDVTKTGLSMRVYVTDAAGLVMFDSEGGRDEGKDYSRWNDVARTLRGGYGARTTRTNPADPDTAILYVAAPVVVQGRTVGVLSVAKPASSVTLFLRSARQKIVMGGVLAGLAVLALGVTITVWITRPLRALAEYARAIGEGRRGDRPRGGRGEIGVLGGAFEQMRESLEGRQYVEQYVQTVTHEMKSPLSAIRGAAELLDEEMPVEKRRRFLENIRAEAGRLQDLIDRLLELAALERRRGLRAVERLELVDLARDVAASFEPMAVGRKIRINVRSAGRVAMEGERFLVRQSAANLVQNALDFSSEGGQIEVTVAQHSDWAVLTVRDHGPGIPDYALGKVFDRFYSLARPGSGKKGTGLGLTFVKEAAELHGGWVRVANAVEGGLLAEVAFPVRAGVKPSADGRASS